MPKLPGVSHRRAVRAFEKAGFWIVREGKHISMTDGRRIIIIPPHPAARVYQEGPFVGCLIKSCFKVQGLGIRV